VFWPSTPRVIISRNNLRTDYMVLTPWGIHSVHNLYRCNAHAIRDAANIYWFTRALVRRIDMKAYGEPQIIHFGSGNKAGYTLVQLIETSNICAHFVEETNDAYLDVFSCKDFKTEDVNAVIAEYFKPENVIHYRLIRQAEPKMDQPGPRSWLSD